jgi:hypothetical protein
MFYAVKYLFKKMRIMKFVTFETSVVYSSSERELCELIRADIELGYINLRKVTRLYSREKLSVCLIVKLRAT